MVLMQNFLFDQLISQLLLKVRLLKFNMFNRYKHNITQYFKTGFSFFSNFKIVNLK